MIQFDLQEDERVLAETEKVKFDDENKFSKAILTNLNIIQIKEGGIFNKTKNVLKTPLSDIKVVNGYLQVLYKRDGLTHHLHIYLKSQYIDLIFKKKSEATQWLNEINKILVLDPIEKEKLAKIEEKEQQKYEQKEQQFQEKIKKQQEKDQEKKERIIEKKQDKKESKEFFKNLRERIVKYTFPEKINSKCKSCGYPNYGKIGSEITCKNCGIEQVIEENKLKDVNYKCKYCGYQNHGKVGSVSTCKNCSETQVVEENKF
ncbi:MAG: hypothetical protein IJX17_01745 [Clostridia bacterium]|nr:hypothetical protein [Clostridia bacterium]